MRNKSVKTIAIKADGDRPGTFSGKLATYGNIDSYGDICMPGCFDGSIKEKGVKFPLLWQHDMSKPIGHFTVTDTEEALEIGGDINLDTAQGKETHSLLKRGDIDGLSIGYNVIRQRYDAEKDANLLLELDLIEGSVVTFAANSMAAVAAVKNKEKRKGANMAKLAKLATLLKLSDEDEEEIVAEIVDLIEEAVDSAIEDLEKCRKLAEEEDEENKNEMEDEEKAAMKSAVSDFNRYCRKARK